jgi:hypothetical protein
VHTTTLGLVTLTSACDHILQGDLLINNKNAVNEVTFDVKQHKVIVVKKGTAKTLLEFGDQLLIMRKFKYVSRFCFINVQIEINLVNSRRSRGSGSISVDLGTHSVTRKINQW